MNVLQYKPEGVTSNKKWITIILVFIGLILIGGGALAFYIREVRVFGASVVLAVVVLIYLISVKNVKEIQISNAELKIRVIWITFNGKEKFQEFEINETLQIKVAPYQPPKFGYGTSASTAHWGIHIFQKGQDSYESGYGLFSQYTLQDLQAEVQAILVRIGKQV